LLTPQVLKLIQIASLLPELDVSGNSEISKLIMPAGRLTFDYAHSRRGIRVNISYPWGGADIGPYPEMGIGKKII
jgi:hypothetical protein